MPEKTRGANAMVRSLKTRRVMARKGWECKPRWDRCDALRLLLDGPDPGALLRRHRVPSCQLVHQRPQRRGLQRLPQERVPMCADRTLELGGMVGGDDDDRWVRGEAGAQDAHGLQARGA